MFKIYIVCQSRHRIIWLENKQSSFFNRSLSNLSITSSTSQLILQPFCRFTYVTAHSPTFPSLHLHHSSFSHPSVALPTSQVILQPLILQPLILQPFHHFTYIKAHSPTLPSLYLRHSSFSNLPLLHLRHSSFSNPSFASPTSQILHLRHLASRPCYSSYSPEK